MKIYLIFVLAMLASSSAEDSKPEAEPKPLQIQWKAKYGEYGVESIVPVQYNIPVYRYGYPSLPYPSMPYPSVQYPLTSYPSIPYPLRVAYKQPGMAVTSYDPDYFSSTYGFYPDQ